MKLKQRILLYLCIVAVLAIVLVPQIFSLMGFPSHLKIIQGIEQSLKINFPFDVYIICDQPERLLVNGKPLKTEALKVNLSEPLLFQSDAIGKLKVDFKLFGLIPIRHMEVDVVPEIKVFPGGHSIGVLLHTDGVMVIDVSYVDGADGRKYYPAREAGVGPGDYLLEMNGKKVLSKQDVAKAIYESGKKGRPLKVKVRKRTGSIKDLTIHPVKSKEGTYMIGLYIDDGVAGVGTLTFYDPKSGFYGALGHVITDAHTQDPIQIRAGEIVNANISGINTGQRGLPGEKLGTFIGSEDVLGVIKKNCEYGIYGKLDKLPENLYFKEPIPVATSRQIKRGRAWIYTVVNGSRIEKFAIEIEHVYHQRRPASRGLIIRIIDPKLLKITGGIVQGMSGSPIVQNGRLVGAVTHVFVNDPKKGYGVLAEWMIKEAGLDRINYKRKLNR
ncbi:SpoIVB peptidase [Anoxybacter fermentans]|uniref:SpoIVB peptidase n=1 Tax=Anoxybacter fermentans TaxID=1323375 RepID=A0A3S9SYT9_9FIRM|nr:SpoIVB peptidase [Anoxybacter fermentans]AZR73513.1 SpoIVB peptidase [Anoxybacter fermentans]